jgi:hypothetical protein
VAGVERYDVFDAAGHEFFCSLPRRFPHFITTVLKEVRPTLPQRCEPVYRELYSQEAHQRKETVRGNLPIGYRHARLPEGTHDKHSDC